MNMGGLGTAKSTSTAEFEKRLECFEKNKNDVDKVNAAAEGKGPDALRLALNPLSVLTPEEITEHYHGLHIEPDHGKSGFGRRLEDQVEFRRLSHAAETVDHHISGRMYPVKD